MFRFLPGEPGQDVLEMEYRRPFNGADVPASKTFKIDLNVAKCRE